MKEEMESMKVTKGWTMVNLCQGHKAIGNKWVLKIKRKAKMAQLKDSNPT